MSSSRSGAWVDWREPIAVGSTCKVFKGMYGGRDIAIKSIDSLHAYNFHDEKDMLLKLNRLNAPNTVKYLDDVPTISSMNHMRCLPLEWMPTNLHAAFSKEELDWRDRYQMMVELTKGVAFYHAHSILHRDIKSLNVLTDEQHNIKFCDFALAVQLELDDYFRGSGCSISWAPPEYLENKPVTYSADIYSLATTFWEIAEWRGEFPFLAQYPNSAEIHKAVLAGKRNEISKSCPNSIAKLITWGWAQDPEERPSAEELLSRLGELKLELL